MPNTYFSRQPLETAIRTIVTVSVRCKVCLTYSPNFIAEDPNYNNWDVLFTSKNKSEVIRKLNEAIQLAKMYGEKCKNVDAPKFEDLIEEPSDSYTLFIRYHI